MSHKTNEARLAAEVESLRSENAAMEKMIQHHLIVRQEQEQAIDKLHSENAAMKSALAREWGGDDAIIEKLVAEGRARNAVVEAAKRMKNAYEDEDDRQAYHDLSDAIAALDAIRAGRK